MTAGSPGVRVQTYCESAFEFHVLVDAVATYDYVALPVSPTIKIIPGPGIRWFAEGGMAIRHVSSTKTSIDSTLGSAATSCCVTTPSLPTNQNVKGGVAGIGLHLVDGIGIRVIPQVRYTYWFTPVYNNQSTLSKKNQVEAMITIGF